MSATAAEEASMSRKPKPGKLRKALKALRALQEERAITETLNRYPHAMDYGREAEWVDVFTPDAVFDVHHPDGEIVHKEDGRDDLARYIARYPRPPMTYTKHFVLNPVIRVDGAAATSESFFLVFRTKGGRPHLMTFGRYYDRLAKGKDGTWRLKERIAEVEAVDPSVSQPDSRAPESGAPAGT
jgi:hypothetical protein